MTPNSFIRITRHASALLAICLAMGLGAGAATAEPAAAATPGSKAGKPGVVAAPTPEARALHERIDKAPEGIAGLHRGSKGLACQKCHAVSTANGTNGAITAPDDNQTVENRECVACHEGYPEMAALTAKKLANKAINPHASHLGPEIACTSCHQGHQESKAYCLNCHTNFSMPMPGNRPAAR